MNTTKTNKLERRDFLKLGAGGLAAGVLSGGCATVASNQEKKNLLPKAAPPPKPAAEPAAPVAKTAVPPRRVLGRTGIEVPIVSMGVMNADNPNLVRAALDGGIFLLDTAHGYQEGRNEEMLGTVLKDRKRDSFVIATKVHLSTLDRKTGLFSKETRGGGDRREAGHQPQAPGARSRRHPSPAQPVGARERAL